MWPWRRRPPLIKPPERRWFQAKDGTYYRNCPLIAAESDEVRDWPVGTPFKWAIHEELRNEWWRTFREGVQRKATLEPRDVVVAPAPFREAYPRLPGLWVLDEERS